MPTNAPLSGSFKKSQYLLGVTIENLFRRVLLSHILFITLTFSKPVHSVKEAQRRMNSFLNKVRPRYHGYLWVLEPHAYGRIQSRGGVHFHLLLPVGFDAHAGTDLDAWRDRDLHDDNLNVLHTSMNPRLREEAKWWTTTARRYGFGRVEVAPIHSNAEAVRLYLTKQDWRSGRWPFVETKSFRFWGCSTCLRTGTVKFAWNTPRALAYRCYLRDWAHQMGCGSLDDLPKVLGKNWGYQFHLHLRDLQAGGSTCLRSDSEQGDHPPMTQGRASGRVGVPAENGTPAEIGLPARLVSGREAEPRRVASCAAPAPTVPSARVPISSLRTVSASTDVSHPRGRAPPQNLGQRHRQPRLWATSPAPFLHTPRRTAAAAVIGKGAGRSRPRQGSQSPPRTSPVKPLKSGAWLQPMLRIPDHHELPPPTLTTGNQPTKPAENHMNSNPMDSDNPYPNPPAASAPDSTPASSSGSVDAGERRFFVVLVGKTLPVATPQPGCASQVLVHAVANVLATTREEAMCRAQEHLLPEDLRPVTALSVGQLKALARDLEECALDPDTSVRLNQGKLRPEDYGLNADGTDPDDMDLDPDAEDEPAPSNFVEVDSDTL